MTAHVFLLRLQLLLVVLGGAPSAMHGHGGSWPARPVPMLAMRGGSSARHSSASLYDAAAHGALLKTKHMLSDSSRIDLLRSTEGLISLAREARGRAERAYHGAASGGTDADTLAIFEARLRRDVTMLLVPYFELYLQLLSAETVSLFNNAVNSSNTLGSGAGVYNDDYISSVCQSMETTTLFFDSSASVGAAAFLGEESQAPAVASGRRNMLSRVTRLYEQMKSRLLKYSSGIYVGVGCSSEILASSIELHRQRLQRAMRAFIASKEAQSRLAGVMPRQSRRFAPVSLQLHWYLKRPLSSLQSQLYGIN